MPRPDSSDEHPGKLLTRLGIIPQKRLGQNFLHDRNIARKIVSLAASLGPPFLEIGPGLGALTALLAGGGYPTVAVEVDPTLAAWLRERFAGTSVAVIEADVLLIPDEEWRRRFPEGGTVVGNLPYAISSTIVLQLLSLREIFPRAVLMLQKEMVERLCAPPGGKEYGTLSVYLAALGEAKEEFLVRRTCFVPSPEVDSAVMTVRFRPGVPDRLYRALRTVVRVAFARRRKTLRNAPVSFLPGGTPVWLSLLAEVGIDPRARAEEIPPEAYLRLADIVSSRLSSMPDGLS
jgi:16S rRNA (adenine1518-N6/adenine1519-N6)-dimethyltransferase